MLLFISYYFLTEKSGYGFFIKNAQVLNKILNKYILYLDVFFCDTFVKVISCMFLFTYYVCLHKNIYWRLYKPLGRGRVGSHEASDISKFKLLTLIQIGGKKLWALKINITTSNLMLFLQDMDYKIIYATIDKSRSTK